MAKNQFITDIIVRLTGDDRQLNKTLAKTERNLDSLNSSVGRLSRSLSGPLVTGLKAAGAAFGLAGAQAVKVGASFDDSVKTLAAITGATGDELNKLENQARLLGATTNFTARQGAQGLQALARAGLATNQIIALSAPALRFAGANATTLNQATTLLAATMKQFTLDTSQATRIVDTLTLASQKSLFDIESLSVAMRYGGSVGKSLGVSLEETVAVMASFRDLGLEGSMVGTRFRQGMLSLINPTKQGKQAIRDFGLNLEDVNPRIVGMVGALRNLGKAGLTVEDMARIVSKRAAGSFTQIAQIVASSQAGQDKISKLIKTFETNAGQTERAYETMINSVVGQTKILLSASEELGISFFRIFDPQRSGVSTSPLIEAIKGLKSFVDDLTLSVRALAPAFSQVFGETVQQVRNITDAIFGASESTEDLATKVAMAAVTFGQFANMGLSIVPIFLKIAKIALFVRLGQGLVAVVARFAQFSTSAAVAANVVTGLATAELSEAAAASRANLIKARQTTLLTKTITILAEVTAATTGNSSAIAANAQAIASRTAALNAEMAALQGVMIADARAAGLKQAQIAQIVGVTAATTASTTATRVNTTATAANAIATSSATKATGLFATSLGVAKGAARGLPVLLASVTAFLTGPAGLVAGLTLAVAGLTAFRVNARKAATAAKTLKAAITGVKSASELTERISQQFALGGDRFAESQAQMRTLAREVERLRIANPNRKDLELLYQSLDQNLKITKQRREELFIAGELLAFNIKGRKVVLSIAQAMKLRNTEVGRSANLEQQINDQQSSINKKLATRGVLLSKIQNQAHTIQQTLSDRRTTEELKELIPLANEIEKQKGFRSLSTSQQRLALDSTDLRTRLNAVVEVSNRLGAEYNYLRQASNNLSQSIDNSSRATETLDIQSSKLAGTISDELSKSYEKLIGLLERLRKEYFKATDQQENLVEQRMNAVRAEFTEVINQFQRGSKKRLELEANMQEALTLVNKIAFAKQMKSLKKFLADKEKAERKAERDKYKQVDDGLKAEIDVRHAAFQKIIATAKEAHDNVLKNEVAALQASADEKKRIFEEIQQSDPNNADEIERRGKEAADAQAKASARLLESENLYFDQVNEARETYNAAAEALLTVAERKKLEITKEHLEQLKAVEDEAAQAYDLPLRKLRMDQQALRDRLSVEGVGKDELEKLDAHHNAIILRAQEKLLAELLGNYGDYTDQVLAFDRFTLVEQKELLEKLQSQQAGFRRQNILEEAKDASKQISAERALAAALGAIGIEYLAAKAQLNKEDFENEKQRLQALEDLEAQFGLKRTKAQLEFQNDVNDAQLLGTTELFKAFESIFPKLQEGTGIFAKLFNSIGDVSTESGSSLQIFGKVLSTVGAKLPTLTKGFSAAGAGIGKLLGAVGVKVGAVLSGPLAPVLALAGPMILGTFTKAFDGIKNAFFSVVSSIQQGMTQIIGFITSFTGQSFDLINLVKSAANELVSAGEDARKERERLETQLAAGQISQSEFNEAMSMGVGAEENPVDVANRIIDELVKKSTEYAKALGDIAPLVLTGLANGIPVIVRTLETSIPKVINAFTQAVPILSNSIGQALSVLIPAAANALAVAIPAIANSLFTTVADNVVVIAESVLSSLKSIIDSAISALPSLISTFTTLIPELFDRFLAIADEVIPRIVDQIPALVDGFNRMLGGLSRSFNTRGPRILRSLTDGLFSLLTEGLAGLIRFLPEFIAGTGVFIELISNFLAALTPFITELAVRLVAELILQLPRLLPILAFTAAKVALIIASDIIKVVALSIAGAINGVREAILGTITESGDRFFAGIENAILTVFDPIINLFTEVVDAFKDVFSSLNVFGDTPSAMQVSSRGAVAGFAPNDFVIAAQSPFELVRQGIDALASSIGGSSPATSAPAMAPQASNQPIDIAIMAEGRLLDAVQVRALDRGHAPEMESKLRRASGVTVGFSRGRYSNFGG